MKKIFKWIRLKRSSSSLIAKQRLKNILKYDHSDHCSGSIDSIQNDILINVSKYMDVASEHVSIEIFPNDPNCEDSYSFLVIKIPFKDINKVMC